MANYANLKSDIAGVIRTNNDEEITGDILQEQLLGMVDSLGAGFQYKGVATPATAPGTPDENVFYIASTAGTYTNFGSLVVAEGEVAILKYNGSWAKEVTGAATAAQVTQLGQDVDDLGREVHTLSGVVGNYILNQYSANRLATDAFSASEFSDFAKMWLSDETDYECTLFASNSNVQSSGTQIVGWGGSKSAIQSAIRSLNYAYAWLFVRKKNNGNLSPSDVWLVGQLPSDVEQLKGDVEQLQEIIVAKTGITIEIGTWIKYPSTGAPCAYMKKSETNRLRSDVYYINNGENVSVICKDGYQCNLYYLNPATGARYITEWNARQSEKKSISEYTQFVVIFKRADGGNVSSSDLDCVESFVINSEFTGLKEDVAGLKAKVGAYSDRPFDGYETFSVECNANVANDTDTALSEQDSFVAGMDKSRLYLPTSYSSTGTPTRLIIHCHGASVNYNYNNFSELGINDKIKDYLLAKGYALLFVSGLPGNSTLHIGTTAGSPAAYQAHIKAYKYVIEKYNIRKDGVFVYGISAGSIPALQIANFTDIPVLAQIIYCGIYSVPRAFMLLGGYSSYAQDMKDYIATQYDFQGEWGASDWSTTDPVSDEEWKHLVDNSIQFAGWNTYLKGATTRISQQEYSDIIDSVYNSLPSWIPADKKFNTVEQMLMAIKIAEKNTQSLTGDLVDAEKALYDTVSLHRDVPLKIFHAKNDATAPYRYAQYYYDMLKRGGSQVEFRTFLTGGHSPYGNDVTVTIDGNTVNTCVFAIESLLFLQRFE